MGGEDKKVGSGNFVSIPSHFFPWLPPLQHYSFDSRYLSTEYGPGGISYLYCSDSHIPSQSGCKFKEIVHNEPILHLLIWNLISPIMQSLTPVIVVTMLQYNHWYFQTMMIRSVADEKSSLFFSIPFLDSLTSPLTHLLTPGPPPWE